MACGQGARGLEGVPSGRRQAAMLPAGAALRLVHSRNASQPGRGRGGCPSRTLRISARTNPKANPSNRSPQHAYTPRQPHLAHGALDGHLLVQRAGVHLRYTHAVHGNVKRRHAGTGQGGKGPARPPSNRLVTSIICSQALLSGAAASAAAGLAGSNSHLHGASRQQGQSCVG